ncbi:hypothetical protein ACLOJK_030109 [Asimina triloba]
MVRSASTPLGDTIWPRMSSKKTSMNLLKYFVNTRFIDSWNVVGALERLNDITRSTPTTTDVGAASCHPPKSIFPAPPPWSMFPAG